MGISPAFGFFRLGTEQSGNINVWLHAVREQRSRLRADLDDEVQTTGDAQQAASFRLDADAHFLLIAVHNGMRFARRIQERVNDQRLAEAIARHAADFPYAGDLRDVLTHLEEYVLDEGRLQPNGYGKRRGEIDAGSSSWRHRDGDDVVMHYAGLSVPLLAFADVSAPVLELACEAWQRGLQDNVDGLK